MQKVLTLTTHTNTIDGATRFTEKEYPKLNEYLGDGYKVIQAVPIPKGADTSYMYAVVFVLEK